MGTDIHWVAERLHSDGSWEAAFSKVSSMIEAGPNWYSNPDFICSPEYQLGERDYRRFGLLSALRDAPNPEIGEIAQAGFPEDISSHTRLTLRAYPDFLHAHGWFTPQMLQEALDTLLGVSSSNIYKEDIRAIRKMIKIVDKIISNQGPCKINHDNILHGKDWNDDFSLPYPDMKTESNHSKITRIARIKDLLPMSRETLRFCIAYDS
jgi:hypothetical protein